MTQIIQEGDHFILIDRYARGMEIITYTEPVANPDSATEFDDVEEAQEMLNELMRLGNDVSKLKIVDKEKLEEEIKQKAKEAADAYIKQLREKYKNATEEEKENIKELVRQLYGDDAAEKCNEFFEGE